MKEILKFLVTVSQLKKMPRTGFVWLGIKNPETIAQHTFRVALLNWLLGQKVTPLLNIKKLIQISLTHDLCEVYAGDLTPYWGLLPKNKKERRRILSRWLRLPQKIKIKRQKIKFQKEKKALERLVKNLPLLIKKEFMNCWLDYEKTLSREGKFVKQGDKVETLLQALEYWGAQPNSPVVGWWEEIDSLVDEPVLLAFLETIKGKFYKHKPAKAELKFLLEVGKLKNMPRTGWILRGVKNPETIAEHTFLLSLASWLLARNKRLNLEKVLKTSLIYEICEVYAGDMTPYDGLLTEKTKEQILKRWPRFSKKEKEKRFYKDYQKEKKALEKLIYELPLHLQKEIINLWDNCKRRLTAEGKFVNQVYWLVTYLQALQYFEKNKNFPILAWYEQMREFIEERDLLQLQEEMENKYLSTRIKF